MIDSLIYDYSKDIGYEMLAAKSSLYMFTPEYLANEDDEICARLDASYKKLGYTEILMSLVSASMESVPVGSNALGAGLLVSHFTYRLKWMNAVNELCFYNNKVEKFVELFADVIPEMVMANNAFEKEHIHFRFGNAGSSVFHLAPALFIPDVLMRRRTRPFKVVMDECVKKVYKAYLIMGETMGDERFILDCKDFNGSTVEDTILSYIERFSELEHVHK